jgi:hypothetical protein
LKQLATWGIEAAEISHSSGVLATQLRIQACDRRSGQYAWNGHYQCED